MTTLVRLLGLALSAVLAAVMIVTIMPGSSTAATGQTKQTTTDRTATDQGVTPRAGCRVPYCYGAITVNVRTGGATYSYNYGTRSGAQTAAYNRCRNGAYPGYCRKIVWVRNGCAAVAYRRRADGSVYGTIGWGTAFTKARAIAKARNAAGGAAMRSYTCTSRR